MPIDHKDEYVTIRQEMLERVERINKKTQYGLIIFFGLLSYYYKYGGLNPAILLLALQIMVILMGSSAIVLYKNIYIQAIYIAFIHEKDSEARWHKMIGLYQDYLKREGKDTRWNKLNRWVFPRTQKWGANNEILSILNFILPFLAFGAISFKARSLTEGFKSFSTPWILLNITAFIANMVVFCKLRYGLEKFRKKTEKIWKRYRNDFGTEKFPDPYE